MNLKFALCAGISGICVLLSGCANSFDHMPDISEKDKAVVEEYAASLILARSDSSRRLATVQEIAYYDERETIRNLALGRIDPATAPSEEAKADTAVSAADPEGQETPGEGMGTPEGATAVEAVEDTGPVFNGIAEFCGAAGFSIDYKSSSITSSYPSDGADAASMFFALDAAPGTSLLVLHFDAVNISGEEKELDLLDSGVRYRITINGEDSKGALTTMLLDDLSSFKGQLAPGDVQPLVLVREIPEGTAVDSISLTLRGADGTVSTTLS